MIYLVVTIDTEPDCTTSWHFSNPLTFKGVFTGIREIIQPLCIKYNIIPTYLLNNVVMEDPQSVDVLKNLDGQYELGTHLHPEFIEPQKTVFNYAGVKASANCCSYPSDIEFAKIAGITQLFINQFGFSPTSFRAGRWSAGQNTYKTLIGLGYKVDTSTSPHIIWKDKYREHTVDYSSAPEQPYVINRQLLEVPVSIVKRYSVKQIVKKMFGMDSDGKRIIWLRPSNYNYHDFRIVYNTFKTKYTEQGIIVLNMMFHNIEVIPALSPYTKTESDCMRYLYNLERFFIFCSKSGIVSLGLSSLYDKYIKE
jgi:hypothetical protein